MDIAYQKLIGQTEPSWAHSKLATVQNIKYLTTTIAFQSVKPALKLENLVKNVTVRAGVIHNILWLVEMLVTFRAIQPPKNLVKKCAKHSGWSMSC